MSYKVSEGISESELANWLAVAKKNFGTFKDGRVNYKDAPIAPIVMCTVIQNDTLLLVKRGYGLADANGYWSTVNGFIDEVKPIKEQVMLEISEELGIKIDASCIKVRDSYRLSNPKEKRVYIVFPCLITLETKPKITLNEENTNFEWIKRADLLRYNVLNDLPLSIDTALGNK